MKGSEEDRSRLTGYIGKTRTCASASIRRSLAGTGKGTERLSPQEPPGWLRQELVTHSLDSGGLGFVVPSFGTICVYELIRFLFSNKLPRSYLVIPTLLSAGT